MKNALDNKYLGKNIPIMELDYLANPLLINYIPNLQHLLPSGVLPAIYHINYIYYIRLLAKISIHYYDFENPFSKKC